MADKKLPEYIEDAFAVVIETYHAFSSGPSILTLRAAIHRYAREREAAALEKAARACATLQVDYGTHICASLFARHVRSLIQKEPAKGNP